MEFRGAQRLGPSRFTEQELMADSPRAPPEHEAFTHCSKHVVGLSSAMAYTDALAPETVRECVNPHGTAVSRGE